MPSEKNTNNVFLEACSLLRSTVFHSIDLIRKEEFEDQKEMSTSSKISILEDPRCKLKYLHFVHFC